MDVKTELTVEITEEDPQFDDLIKHDPLEVKEEMEANDLMEVKEEPEEDFDI